MSSRSKRAVCLVSGSYSVDRGQLRRGPASLLLPADPRGECHIGPQIGLCTAGDSPGFAAAIWLTDCDYCGSCRPLKGYGGGSGPRR